MDHHQSSNQVKRNTIQSFEEMVADNMRKIKSKSQLSIQEHLHYLASFKDFHRKFQKPKEDRSDLKNIKKTKIIQDKKPERKPERSLYAQRHTRAPTNVRSFAQNQQYSTDELKSIKERIQSFRKLSFQEDLFDFLTELVMNIEYVKEKRVPVQELSPEKFLNVLTLIEEEFEEFYRDFSGSEGKSHQQVLNKETAADMFVNQLLYLLPGIKEGLNEHREVFEICKSYRNQCQRLMSKSIFPRIIVQKCLHKFLNDMSEEDEYCLADEEEQRTIVRQGLENLIKKPIKEHVTIKLKGQSFKISYQTEDKVEVQNLGVDFDSSEPSFEEEKKKEKKKKKRRNRKKKQLQSEALQNENAKDEQVQKLCEQLDELNIDLNDREVCRVQQTLLNRWRAELIYQNRVGK